MQNSVILMSLSAASRVDGVNEDQFKFLYHYFQLSIKKVVQSPDMTDLDGHLGEVNKASTNGNLLARRVFS